MEVLDHAFRVRRNILQAGTPLGGPIEDLLGLFNGQNLSVDQLKDQHLSCSRNLGVFKLTVFPWWFSSQNDALAARKMAASGAAFPSRTRPAWVRRATRCVARQGPQRDFL
jgi:hypothetical protein